MKAIEITNLSYKYGEGDSPFVIRNLDLSIEKGEYVCILGENGSGKSTLSRLINGLLQPTTGKVKVFGVATDDKENVYEVRKRVGLVFQNPDNQMVATMVEDDIAFGPENLGVPPKEIAQRIDFALTATNMQKYRGYAGQKLSGGQKQRVAIAGVLAIKPDIIILDESTSMLDGRGRREVLEVVKNLNKEGITVIAITHYIDEAVNASRIVVLNNGEVVKQGTPSEIFSNSKELVKYGLELPKATYIANGLINNGIPLKSGILTESQLVEELCNLFQKG